MRNTFRLCRMKHSISWHPPRFSEEETIQVIIILLNIQICFRLSLCNECNPHKPFIKHLVPFHFIGFIGGKCSMTDGFPQQTIFLLLETFVAELKLIDNKKPNCGGIATLSEHYEYFSRKPVDMMHTTHAIVSIYYLLCISARQHSWLRGRDRGRVKSRVKVGMRLFVRAAHLPLLPSI